MNENDSGGSNSVGILLFHTDKAEMCQPFYNMLLVFQLSYATFQLAHLHSLFTNQNSHCQLERYRHKCA